MTVEANPAGSGSGLRARLSSNNCDTCAADLRFLQTKDRPDFEGAAAHVRIADLFAGGGGFSLGAAEAARRQGLGTSVALAVDNAAVADVYALNFPTANLVRASVAELFTGEPGARATKAERVLARNAGHLDVLLAGPPCQGHSDLNNHTRRQDPRNALYLCAARAAEVLRPTFVLIENVPSARHDKGNVVMRASEALESAGYTVAGRVLDLSRFGIPQRRHRHILLAALGDFVNPRDVLDATTPCAAHAARSVRWAIADLVVHNANSGLDIPSNPSPENRTRMQWLIDQGEYDLPNEMRPKCHHDAHSYKSMYGRLAWDRPAPTITTGFGSMGQGRFVHPAMPRTITPHEAARLQTLPDFFDFDISKGRSAWARVIGNAVPPLLGVHLVEQLLRSLPGGSTESATKERTAAVAYSRRGTRRVREAGVPPASSEVIRIRMANMRRRDTKPELALRSALHALGLRFSVDRSIEGTRRRVDIVFRTERVAVFVDGCFWHSCPEHRTVPKRNREWWLNKLAANRRRDSDTDATLAANGWTVLRFWEHDDPHGAAVKVREAVFARREERAAGKRQGR